MNIKTIKFQQDAIERIYENTIKLLNADNVDGKYKKIIFQSPTGSGKTVMASKIVEKIALDDNTKVSFIWVSKGHLAEQSKKSFEKYIGGGGLKFSSLEDILDNEIKENEVLFTNWEKIFTKAGRDKPEKDIKKGDWTNKFMRDNEWDRNLTKFCENTRNAGRKIILIIDESHLSITENTIKIMAEVIKPVLRIDITATPKKENYEYGDRDGEFITLDQVKSEEIIKKEVVVNANIKQEYLEKSEKDGDLIIFEKAIEKRDELLEKYKKVGSDVKPLILIQLPNGAEKLSSTDKEKIDWVEKILEDKYGADYKNEKVAKWLSGDKSEAVEKISDFDSPVEFLIFKQAIATGWDCPRAQILIKFRQTRSETFEIQTVGRIMRSPEFKYYDEEVLNRAYVYANLNEIKIDEGAFEYIKTKIARRNNSYKDIDLHSIYLTRGDQNTLQLDYRKYFYSEFFKKINGKTELEKGKFNFDKFRNYKNKNGTKINLDIKNLNESIILDETIKDIDQEIHLEAKEKAITIMSDFEVEKAFLGFLENSSRGWNKTKTVSTLKQSVYDVFEKFLEIEKNKIEFQKIVLANKWFFIEVIEASIKEYSKSREKTKKSVKVNNKWNVPEEDFYPKNSVEGKKHKKSIMSPSFYESKWKTEVGFIDNYLEKDEKIDWWYKNGDAKNEIYFGVLFKDGDKEKTFYPDFIIQYKDGRIGIVDTKMGDTATSEDTRLKANALSKSIEKWNKEGKNLFGGIMVPVDKTYKKFKLNQNLKHNYNFDKGDWDIWE